MSEIIPAILPKSFHDLKEGLSLVQGLVPLVQVDICDGRFTPEKSWPNIISPDPDFVKIIREEEGFPFWEDLDVEFDLMVKDPEAEIQQWISAGASRIIVHYESFESENKAQDFVKKFKEQFEGDGSFTATELGVALNIETDNKVIESLVEYLDFVQCMGIAKIGYQGQPFDERVISKVQDLRSTFPNLPISVDGGVSLESAQRLIDAGADRLVVGSAIYKSDDIEATIQKFADLT